MPRGRQGSPITWLGKQTTLSAVARESGIDIGTLRDRWQAGDRDKSLVRPKRSKKPVISPPSEPLRAPRPVDPMFDLLVARWNRAVTGEQN